MYIGNYRITYYDLDLMGRVKLSALLRMVHIAADVNANELGIGFTKLTSLNMSFVLQRFALGIARMPVYDENITIRTWADSVSRGTFLRKGDMYDENGNKIMEWTSMWILFDIAERKILKPSALPVMPPAAQDHGVIVMPEKIILPQGDKLDENGEKFSHYTHTVRYAEVDTNMHMNNSIYGDLIGNALFPDMETVKTAPPWREVQINYLAETRFGDKIEISAYRNNGGLLAVGRTADRVNFAARVR